MQLPSILATITLLGVTTAGVVTPRVAPETYTLRAEVPVLPDGWGYLVTPAARPGSIEDSKVLPRGGRSGYNQACKW